MSLSLVKLKLQHCLFVFSTSPSSLHPTCTSNVIVISQARVELCLQQMPCHASSLERSPLEVRSRIILRNLASCEFIHLLIVLLLLWLFVSPIFRKPINMSRRVLIPIWPISRSHPSPPPLMSSQEDCLFCIPLFTSYSPLY